MIVYLVGSLLLSMLFLKVFIDRLCHLKPFCRAQGIASQKKTCVSELHGHKSEIPNMGGLVFLLVLALATLINLSLTGQMIWLNLFLLLFGVMGYIDDYIKNKRIRDGVSPLVKLLGQTLISVGAVFYLMSAHLTNDRLLLPFFQTSWEPGSLPYAIICVFLVVASSNSMNLTDGLDGLAVGISAIALAFIGVIALLTQRQDVLLDTVVLGGACFSMLWFNKNPARVFMGDTGSLLLGGSIALLLIRLQMPLWIPLLLAVCFFESLSVILQVFSFKVFHKRLFKIAPFHHHLEKCGWPETRIIYMFWGLCMFTCLLAVWGLAGGR